MLTSYLNLTRQLLQNPPAPATLYTDANLTTFINIARGQIAGEGECCRSIGVVNAVVGQRSYNFSTMTFPLTPGIGGAINIRRIQYVLPTGPGSVQAIKWVNAKSWEYFDYYRFNNPVPSSGPPTEWAQYGQGSAGVGSITGVGSGTLNSGSFYVDPLPDLPYAFGCDCTCYPAALAVDTDVEAIPYLWTDAVPYYAAYMALMSSQTSVRLDQAQRLFQLFEQFMSRARGMANPPQNNFNYEQSVDASRSNRLGISQPAGAR